MLNAEFLPFDIPYPGFCGTETMILCIESWKGDIYLTGKKISVAELKYQIRQAERLFDRAQDNFIPLLCRLYGWEMIAVSPYAVSDYTYDADTGLIF